MRPSVLPRLIVAPQQQSDTMADSYYEHANSPHSIVSAHSRHSSAASDSSSPLTHTFSFQDFHPRYSDSTSSLGTTPPKQEQSFDSARASKTTLDDLPEVPDERDDDFDLCDIALTTSQCQCASPFCFRQCASALELERPNLDYSLADGFNSDSDGPLRVSKIRRTAGDSSVGKLANRISSRMPSISKRVRDKTSPISSGQQQGVRSAPISRTPSMVSSRFPSMTKSFIHHVENQDLDLEALTPPSTPKRVDADRVSQIDGLPPTDNAVLYSKIEEPIDRKALASTPLLPTPMIERRGSENDSIQSPLQSPTVADSPRLPFFGVSPASMPSLPAQGLSPPLSSRPSFASVGGLQSSQMLSLSENCSAESNLFEDRWAAKLGHSNFVIHPAPYMPTDCDTTSCKRMVEDWEEARLQYLNQAARTGEHFGHTSQIYKLTEQKWAEIDGQWRKNHEKAVAQAKKSDQPRCELSHEFERDYQPLAEPCPLSKFPSLNDAKQTGKFPNLDDADIVGPMVQYAQITTQASKRTAVLKFFKDLRFPGNTLSSSSGVRG